MSLTRRRFLRTGVQTLAAFHAHPALRASFPVTAPDAPGFRTRNQLWQSTYDAALRVLAANVRTLPRYPFPVLTEGAEYPGIWQECGPHEALVYRRFRPDVARHSHLTFFALQRPDGQFPANNKLSEAGFGQIQMVVPIAATAWELAQAIGDSELLEKAYTACSAWDAWLLRYRNTRGTGLIEGFCTYDTGHDNSPRWAGIPNQCPGKDARRCPPLRSLPRLCPDLSATVYGGRRALAAMAQALGKPADADRWAASADTLRTLILTRLYVPEDAGFYDLDAQNRFVRIRCDILTRVCGEHLPDQHLFDDLWSRQLGNPHAFWVPFPLPSVALDDPLFVRPIPRNSWGGASQALTALRAPRWFDHYHRSADLTRLMDAWCLALQRDPTFRQQLDPLTGTFAPPTLSTPPAVSDFPATSFTPPSVIGLPAASTNPPGGNEPTADESSTSKTNPHGGNYSPAALVFLDFTWRLAGIHEDALGLHWNVQPHHPATQDATFTLTTNRGRRATLTYSGSGATLTLDGHRVAQLAGGAARLHTDPEGRPLAFRSISPTSQTPTLNLPHHPPRKLTLSPNQALALA